MLQGIERNKHRKIRIRFKRKKRSALLDILCRLGDKVLVIDKA